MRAIAFVAATHTCCRKEILPMGILSSLIADQFSRRGLSGGIVTCIGSRLMARAQAVPTVRL
jgi:hypothetical protein